MIPEDLVRKINRGRCFVLVGSGPSCDAGYPTWCELAKQTYQVLLKESVVKDTVSYEDYLNRGKFPELFRLAETDLGDREKLFEIVRSKLKPENRNEAYLYKLLGRWPFACYLTTNYDDELKGSTSKAGKHFEVLRNRLQDFYHVRDGASGLIWKLHSDLEHPDEAVLTSEDYQKYYVGISGQYFRDKLRQIFEMFDVFIIGHSLVDSDIDYVLQVARQTSTPLHRIHMISDGFSKAEEAEFLVKYNIELIRYANTDGKHSQLRRLLSAVDRFIVPREHVVDASHAESFSTEEVETASALFLFRSLQSQGPDDALKPLLLLALSRTGSEFNTIGVLKEQASLRHLAQASATIDSELRENLTKLTEEELVLETTDLFSLTPAGVEKVSEIRSIGDLERKLAFGQFIQDLKSKYPSLDAGQEDLATQAAIEAIVKSFKSRGLAIAKGVFAGQSTSPDELSDIFGQISQSAAKLETYDLQAAFVEAMHSFIVSPSDSQKKYIASISQGYFLYHMLGLDPSCSRLRREVFENTVWLCDSSILLPFLAAGCHNHQYALEMFRTLTDANAMLYTTSKLLQEAWEHLVWAINFHERNSVTSTEFHQAALVKGSYKQNLFLDGYIRESATGHVVNFNAYLEKIWPGGVNRKKFEDAISLAGIKVQNISDVSGFSQQDWGELEQAKSELENQRKLQGTYRSELQVESESEIWVLVKNLRSGRYSLADEHASYDSVYFISQSRILDKIGDGKGVTTWSPEAVYRYLSALPNQQADPSLLQQCMLHEFFYAHISFIDQTRYLRFFGPSIDSSKVSFREEKARYVSEVGQVFAGDLEEAFDRTPDLEKPFFVAQMGWKLAEAAKEQELRAKQGQKEAINRALIAESRSRQLQAEKDAAWKVRESRRKTQEEARLRNLKNPKHLRRRKKQAKKRKRMG